jgi:hypothetical protein
LIWTEDAVLGLFLDTGLSDQEGADLCRSTLSGLVQSPRGPGSTWSGNQRWKALGCLSRPFESRDAGFSAIGDTLQSKMKEFLRRILTD